MLGNPPSVERWLASSAAPSDEARINAVRQRLFGQTKRTAPEHYTLHEELGRGRFGRVYRATDTRFPRIVAVKVIAYDPRSTIELERLEREAHSLAQLSHPNIVQIHEKGISDIGSYFLAMEYVEGPRLDVWCEERRPTLREILRVFAQAADGLHHAHQRQLIHRDFKPSNVLVDNDGRVRILDFGLAKATSPSVRTATSDSTHDASEVPSIQADGVEESNNVGSSSTVPFFQGDETRSYDDGLTEVGVFVGTPHYASPEQLAGAKVDARSDQFSLCVALFEAVYGSKPFKGRTIAEVRTSIESGPTIPARPSTRVPRWLKALLRRGLSPRPSDRFDHMGEIEALLRQYSSRHVRPRFTTLSAGAAAAAAAIFAVVKLSAPVPVDTNWEGAWPESVGPDDVEELHGRELRQRLEDYESKWRHSLATYDHTPGRDPKGPAVRCFEAGKHHFTRYVANLGTPPLASLDGRIATTREHVWLEELFEPEGCLLPQPEWEQDQDVVNLLLQADEAQARGDYDVALGALEDVRQRVPREPTRRSGLIDYQLGTMQMYTHDPAAWSTLAEAEISNGEDPQFVVDVMSRRIEAGAFSDAVDTRQLQVLLERLQARNVEIDPAIINVVMGHVNFRKGDRREAKKNYADARKIYEARPGPDRTTFIIAYCQLHEVFMESWENEPKIDQAEVLAAFEVIRGRLPQEHPTTLRFAIKVARVLENIGELESAQMIIDRAIEDRGTVSPTSRIAYFDTLRARAERMHVEIMLGRKNDSISTEDLRRWKSEAEAIDEGGLHTDEPAGRRAEIQRVRELLIEAYGRLSDIDAAVQIIGGMANDAKTKQDQDDVCYYARPFGAYTSRMSDTSKDTLARTLEECPGEKR